MKFIERVQQLPEFKRKIIFWAVLSLLAGILLVWWFSRIGEAIQNI